MTKRVSNSTTGYKRLLGAHVSIAGGISYSIDRGTSIGATAIQIFTGYNNRWLSRPIQSHDLQRFHQNRHKLKMIFAHNNYLINLATENQENLKKSLLSLGDELKRAEQLMLPYLVIHPGSHLGRGENRGLKRIAQNLNLLLKETSTERVKILLENTAGQGSTLGYKFEHLFEIMEQILFPDRIGICFDTCHAFAAGYDLRTPSVYEKTFDRFDKTVGISKIFAFHLNDSRYDLGSKKDRHEHIGKGLLGMEAFRLLLNDERFYHLPMILETPKSKDLAGDIDNLNTLRSLIGTK